MDFPSSIGVGYLLDTKTHSSVLMCMQTGCTFRLIGATRTEVQMKAIAKGYIGNNIRDSHCPYCKTNKLIIVL